MPSKPIDLQYLQTATAMIQQHPSLQQRQLRVAAGNGRLLLVGEVPTYFEKQLAQEALRQFDESATIENSIEVCK